MALPSHFRVTPALSGAVIMCSLNAFAFEESWKQGSVPDPQSSEIPAAPASFPQRLSVTQSPLKLPLPTPPLSLYIYLRCAFFHDFRVSGNNWSLLLSPAT